MVGTPIRAHEEYHMQRRIINGIATAIIALAMASCDFLDSLSAPKKLDFIGLVGGIDTGAKGMDVATDGTIFIHDYDAGGGFNPTSLYILKPGASAFEEFKDSNGAVISGNFFYVDKSDLVNVFGFVRGYGTARRRFKASGEGYDIMSIPAALGDDAWIFSHSNSSALAPDGSIWAVTTAYQAVSADDEYFKLIHVSKDLEVIGSLRGAALAALIPGWDLSDEGRASAIFWGIGVAANGDVLLPVDKTIGENDNDGVLILGSDMAKKGWQGGDWMMNGPSDADVDANGNIYVVNDYHQNVKVYDSAWKKVGQTDEDVIDDGDPSTLNAPSICKIVGGTLYVFDYLGEGQPSSHGVYAFKTLNAISAPSPEALPPQGTPIAPPENHAPAITSLQNGQAYFSYDINGNYMGGIFPFTASATDADGDTLTYTWELSAGADHCSIAGTGTSATVTGDSFGSGTVKLTVSDGKASDVAFASFSHP
jgi:hypothetical protein